MTLRETALMPMDVADIATRRVLRQSCNRVASAFDASLPAVDAGPVQKVVVALWASREPLPDSKLPMPLTRGDDILEVGRSFDPARLINMEADVRAQQLLGIHCEAIRAVCERYGWDGDAVDAARAAAEDSGIVARRQLGQIAHRGGKWAVEAEGWTDEQGLHVTLRVLELGGGTVLREVQCEMPGGWHELRGLLHAVAWRGSVATIKPLGRAAAAAIGELPSIDMSGSCGKPSQA